MPSHCSIADVLLLLESFAENLHIKESHSPSPSCLVVESSQCVTTEVDGIQYVAYTEPLLTSTNNTTTNVIDTPTSNSTIPTALECTDERPAVVDDSTVDDMPTLMGDTPPTTPRRSSRNKTKM